VKVLFDENVPHKLRRSLAHHDVRTVADMEWTGLQNGELLNRAEGAAFEVMITGDQNLVYQQSLKERGIALVVLDTNNWNVLKRRPEITVQAVDAATPGSFTIAQYRSRVTRRRTPPGPAA
jgi:hypothetical protein